MIDSNSILSSHKLLLSLWRSWRAARGLPQSNAPCHQTELLSIYLDSATTTEILSPRSVKSAAAQVFLVFHSLILFASHLQKLTPVHQLFVTVLLRHRTPDTAFLHTVSCLLLSSISFSCPFFFFFTFPALIFFIMKTKASCSQKLHGKNCICNLVPPLDRMNIEELDVNHQQGFADQYCFLARWLWGQ